MHDVGRLNGSHGSSGSPKTPPVAISSRAGALLAVLVLVGCFNPDDAIESGTDAEGTEGTAMTAGPTSSATTSASATTSTSATASAGPTASETGSPTTTSTAESGTTDEATTGDTDASSTGEPSDCPGGDPTPGEAPYLLTTVLTAHGSTDVDVADINGDGNTDIISLAASEGSVESFFGDGAGGFSSQGPIVLNAGGYPDRVRLGAISDDTVDLFVHMEGPVELWITRGDGAGNWPSPQVYESTYVRAIDLGDLNGDGILDIAYVGAVNLDVRLGANTESYANPVPYGGNNGTVIRIADITGDGNVDILTAGYGSNELQILAGDGAGLFAAQPGAGIFRRDRGRESPL